MTTDKRVAAESAEGRVAKPSPASTLLDAACAIGCLACVTFMPLVLRGML